METEQGKHTLTIFSNKRLFEDKCFTYGDQWNSLIDKGMRKALNIRKSYEAEVLAESLKRI